jgi:hypothetical protein
VRGYGLVINPAGSYYKRIQVLGLLEDGIIQATRLPANKVHEFEQGCLHQRAMHRLAPNGHKQVTFGRFIGEGHKHKRRLVLAEIVSACHRPASAKTCSWAVAGTRSTLPLSNYRKDNLALDVPVRGPFVRLTGLGQRKRAVDGDAHCTRLEQAPKLGQLRAVGAHLGC